MKAMPQTGPVRRVTAPSEKRILIRWALGLLTICGACLCPGELIVGWESWHPTSARAASQTGGAAGGSAVRTSGTWGIDTQAASIDGTFGSLSTPAASTYAGADGAGVMVRSASGTFSFTVTAGSHGIGLTGFHFDAQRKRSKSPEHWSVSTISGPITLADDIGGPHPALPTLGAVGPSDHQDLHVDLTGLADRVLEPGQSATFEIAFAGGTGDIDQYTYLDNAALTGVVLSSPVDTVRVETRADGTGSVLPATNLTPGASVIGYAIARDAGGVFLSNTPAIWRSIQPSSRMSKKQ